MLLQKQKNKMVTNRWIGKLKLEDAGKWADDMLSFIFYVQFVATCVMQ